MSATHLTGLDGKNPIGFFAALGVQVAFASEIEQPRLWWTDGITPHAVVDGDFTIDRIANQVAKISDQWINSAFMRPRRPDGTDMPKGDELKLAPDDLWTYLYYNAPDHSLVTALVAEGSLDRKGVAKPTDFNFTAGQQKFLSMAREILSQVSEQDLSEGLKGPWRYNNSKCPSLMWDTSDDRVHALMARKPSSEVKLTNPGPEALAILGLSMHPVFARKDRGRTLTQGCSGSWTKGCYSWPLWGRPARLHAVKSLLAHAYHEETADRKRLQAPKGHEHSPVADRQRWFRGWGVFTIFKAKIKRSGKGYASFRPTEVAWKSPA